jgi:hypothetical protein
VSWDYRIEPSALRDLGPNAITEVRRYLDERIRGASDPAAFGKPLRGDKHGYCATACAIGDRSVS